MGKPEGIVENYLIREADRHGCLCYKFVSPGHNGVPDRIVINHGKVTFIELKSATGRLSRQQTFVIRKMRDAGADVRVYHSKQQIDDFFAEPVDTASVPQNLTKGDRSADAAADSHTL